MTLRSFLLYQVNEIHVSGVTLLVYLFCTQPVAFSQNTQNALLLYAAPGVSSTLGSKNSEFDKKYFYVWSPRINFSAEMIYQQMLNNMTSVNAGLGINTVSYELNHYNYLEMSPDELINKKILCINYKIPVFLKYAFELNSLEGNICATLGTEINFINAYDEHIEISGGGSGNDSTLYADYKPYAINSSIRTGVEFNNFLKNKSLNFFANMVYQIRPYGQITIQNSYTDSEDNIYFKGNVYPKQIALFAGLRYSILQNI